MVTSSTLCETWAGLFRYPGGVGHERLVNDLHELRGALPELGDDLEPLANWATEREPSALEELFTRTFDSNAERALEVGWHLHGENYARGVFLVRMRGLLREAGVTETTELPDHLSHLLLVMARSEPDVAGALARGVVTPALAKIAAGFDNQENPYFCALRGLERFLKDAATPDSPVAGAQEGQRHE